MSGLWRNDKETPEGKYPIVLRRDGTVLTKPYFVLVDCDPGFVAAMSAYADAHEELESDQNFVNDIRSWVASIRNNPPPSGDPTSARYRKDDPAILAWARDSKRNGGVSTKRSQ